MNKKQIVEQQAIRFYLELKNQEYPKDEYNLTDNMIKEGLI